MMTMDLNQEELNLEEEAIALGVRAYMKMVEDGRTNLPPHMLLLRKYVKLVEGPIAEWLDSVSKGNGRQRGSAYHFLNQFSPEELAYVGVKTTIDALSVMHRPDMGGQTIPLTTLANKAGRYLEDAVDHEKLREADPGAYRSLQKRIAQTNTAKIRHVLIRNAQRHVGIKPIKWGEEERVSAGWVLLKMVEESGLITIQKERTGVKTALVVRPGPGVFDWLSSAHAHAAAAFPASMPMVVPPREWHGPFGGGYLKHELRRPLIKTPHAQYLEELKSVRMPKFYAAVNAMQQTEWRINTAILRVAEELVEQGGTLNVEGIVRMEPIPMPPRLPEEVKESDPAAFSAWKKEAFQIHTENNHMISKRLQMLQILWMANRVKDFDAIYFPVFADWRGRLYYQGRGLNPQGNSLAKGLLEFANGVPLGDTGLRWLAIHGANSFGIDKVSFQERQAWVEEHDSEIMATAVDPLGSSFGWWSKADAPWQFLAFCLEWAALRLHVSAGGSVEEFASHIPVGLDGTCNGLQNFAALLLDPEGAKATNLVPADRPQDIYATVAKLVNEYLGDVLSKHSQGQPVEPKELTTATKWAGKVTRKMTKRNTMTVPYGVTRYGMREQMMGVLRDMVHAGETPSYTPEEATVLADLNGRAIYTVVSSAKTAQAWLQEVAKAAASRGLPVHWTTPTGLPVLQSYYKTLGRRMDVLMAGERISLQLSKDGTEIDKSKQSAGISPNLIHSLDAAHLQSTVGHLYDLGLRSFAMIHDSYGTHAGNVEVLGEVLRECFVEQYRDDVLAGFRDEIAGQLPEEEAVKLPAAPARGTLDLSAVLDSAYFFS